MANCPLYKRLKKNGTSFYAFPGAGVDLSATYQNENLNVYFSKFALLNLPKQNKGNDNEKTYFDFDNSFYKTEASNDNLTFSDAIIESLRNYVANYETTIRSSKLNDKEYFYNNNSLSNPTERIFWKWCKKLGLIEFEPAIAGDEYLNNLVEFEPKNINDDSYFPEILWKERESKNFQIVKIKNETINSNRLGFAVIYTREKTNIKVGDVVNISRGNQNIIIEGNKDISEITHKVTEISREGEFYKIFIQTKLSSTNEFVTTNSFISLFYNRLVNYIGEVSGLDNSRNNINPYTNVMAHIPDHTGKTPDILFKLTSDDNYKPNMEYPIIPTQNQPEIVGAENFSNPIVSNPQNYPGNYYAHFDTDFNSYTTENGDSERRSGDYYGIRGNVNDLNKEYNADNIDGLSVDFNTNHYSKMNIIGRNITNFDQFNALSVSGLPPRDFEFNAILWYYTIVDDKGNSYENLYGITFMEHPENNQIVTETNIKFPTYKKLVTTDEKDGTSYTFSLNISFNFENSNPKDMYNPDSINGLFSFSHYSEAMSRLKETNDSFKRIITQYGNLVDRVDALSQMVYTNSNINTINSKLTYLEKLIQMYSTNQLLSSDTIGVDVNRETNPPMITLHNKDLAYGDVVNIRTKNLFLNNNVIPYNINIYENKNMLVNITNDDNVNTDINNDESLLLILNRDLSFKQSIDILIRSSEDSTENKKMTIYIKSNRNGMDNQSLETILINTIDLPIAYNMDSSNLNSSTKYNECKLTVNLTDSNSIQLQTGNLIKVKLNEPQGIISNTLLVGDYIVLSDLLIKDGDSLMDFSGQYKIVSIQGNEIFVDISKNKTIVAYSTSSISLPMSLTSKLNSVPFLEFNKGYKFRITRVLKDGETNSSGNKPSLNEIYAIEKTKL